MRFIEFTSVLLFINVVLALFAQLGLGSVIGMQTTIQSTESISDGNLQETNKSISQKLTDWSDDRLYINQGVQSDSQQYLQSGGDFVQAWNIFSNIFLGGFILHPTLVAFNVPGQIIWFFLVPYYLIYAIAVMQFFSGRQIESQ